MYISTNPTQRNLPQRRCGVLDPPILGHCKGFSERVDAGAENWAINRNLGNMSPLGIDYDRNLFQVATSSRSLMRAFHTFATRSPMSTGADGLSSADLTRYGAYQVWRTYVITCGCAVKVPDYRETLFCQADLRQILLLIVAFGEDKGHLPELRWRWTDRYRSGTDFGKSGFVTLPLSGSDLSAAVIYQAGIDSQTLRDVARWVIGEVRDLRRHFREIRMVVQPSFRRYLRINNNKALEKRLLWVTMRWLSRVLRSGAYEPGHLQRDSRKKRGGGRRYIGKPNLLDKIVDRAILNTLRPAFKHIFLPCCILEHPGQSPYHALQAMNRQYRRSGRKFLVLCDVIKAFDTVPHDVLLRILQKYIPDSRLIQLIVLTVSRPGKRRAKGLQVGYGIGQGQPLSVFLLNLVLHDALDLPLRRNQWGWLVRYIDDLGSLAISRAHGHLIVSLWRLCLAAIGLKAHVNHPKMAIVDLGGLQEAILLGFRVVARKAYLEFWLPRDWKRRLRDALKECAQRNHWLLGRNRRSDFEERLRHCSLAWIQFYGPAYKTQKRRTVLREVCRQVDRIAGRPILTKSAVRAAWQRGWREYMDIPMEDVPDVTSPARKQHSPLE